jgi:hypothetical protein
MVTVPSAALADVLTCLSCWQRDGDWCLCHDFSMCDTTTLAFLPNVVRYLLYCLHEPVGLSISCAIKVVAVQLFFSTLELHRLYGCLVPISFPSVVPSLFG